MRQKPENSRHAPKEPVRKAAKEKGSSPIPAMPGSTVMAIRLVLASVVFAVSLIVEMPAFLQVILLVVSGAAAGYDVALKALNAIETGDYFAVPVVVVFTALLSYFIGFGIEGAALLILYQIGLILINYATENTKKSALELLNYQSGEVKEKLGSAIGDSEALYMPLESVLGASAGKVLKLMMVFSVVYAVAMPLITNMGFAVSIHRALTMLLIATPMSVVVAVPLASAVGLCYSAQQGVVINKASTLDAMAESSVAVFDKGGIFADECPRIVAMYSDVLDPDTFMNFVAHAVYYSEQPVAKAIAAAYSQEYRLDMIHDFKEIPGIGMQLSIEDIPVIFGTRELFSGMGIDLPEDKDAIGQAFYMVVAKKYVGKVVISTQVNDETEGLIQEMKAVGFSRCTLLTEDDQQASQQFAELMDFTEVYPQCDTEKKLSTVEQIASREKGAVIFVYSSGIESHSQAAVDLRVGSSGKFADGIVDPDHIMDLPFAKQVSTRVKEIVIENALFAFGVKALLIFLSIIGYCNLWFAMFIDMVAAVATILNTIRVTQESMIASLRYKMGR